MRKTSKLRSYNASPPMRPPGYELLTRVNEWAKALAAGALAAIEALERGDLSDASRGLPPLRDKLTSLASLTNEVEQVERSWAEQLERDFLELETTLRQTCASRGWRLDGQWPKFYVERGVPVTVDEKVRAITISDQRFDRLNAMAVIGHLGPIVSGLIPRNFSTRAFVAALAKAYDSARGHSSQVPILDVYCQVVLDQQKPRFWKDARTDAFIGMSIDQFRARLSRILEEGPTTTSDQRELRMLPPLDPKDAIFLYQPAEARFGFVGRIEFVSPRIPAV